MKFLRHATIDIAITIFIVIAVFVNSNVLNIALAILTVLLLLARLSVLSNKEMSKQLSKKQKNVPDLFYHILNGINVALLLGGQKWLLAAAWCVIWYLSWKTLTSARSSSQNRKKNPRA